jgi:hypothetical protein
MTKTRTKPHKGSPRAAAAKGAERVATATVGALRSGVSTDAPASRRTPGDWRFDEHRYTHGDAMDWPRPRMWDALRQLKEREDEVTTNEQLSDALEDIADALTFALEIVARDLLGTIVRALDTASVTEFVAAVAEYQALSQDDRAHIVALLNPVLTPDLEPWRRPAVINDLPEGFGVLISELVEGIAHIAGGWPPLGEKPLPGLVKGQTARRVERIFEETSKRAARRRWWY